MPNFEKSLEEIRETKRQIRITNSPQRKYELNRHLKKLLREYKRAKMYVHNGKAQHKNQEVVFRDK